MKRKVLSRALTKAPTPACTNQGGVAAENRDSLDLLTRRGTGTNPLVPEIAATLSSADQAAGAEFEAKLGTAFGCRTSETALALLKQVMVLEHPTTTMAPERSNRLLLEAIALVSELQPATATEAMLAAQMVGTQRLAMRFLARATVDGLTDDAIDCSVARASRLMQLFCVQVDAMSKLKGKGVQQRVVVEHVSVAAGGQAIVGAVVAGGRGSGGHGR